MASSPPVSSLSDSLPFATLIHMLTIKLTSTNYLLWRSQVSPLLVGQGLIGLIDGSRPAPPPEIITDGQSVANPDYQSWRVADQRLVSLLFSSLTEEAMSIVVGCATARDVWVSLENTFSHQSKAREFRHKGQLQTLRKGDQSVAEFGRQFKTICDQLSAIGVTVSDTDKIHLFMKGLGSAFSNFSATQMALSPSFSDLLNNAEAWDLFQQNLDPLPSPTAAFAAHTVSSPTTAFASDSGSHHRHMRPAGRGQKSGGRGASWQRRPPQCQICRKPGHYATVCSERFTQPAAPSANIAEAFSASCRISDPPTSD